MRVSGVTYEATFDYLMAYKDRVENLIKREPWNKITIGDDFYKNLFVYGGSEMDDNLLFYFNDVVRYNIYFGYRRIKELIEKALEIQNTLNGAGTWGVDYLIDFLGERFETEADGSLTKVHFIDQENVISMFYKHLQAKNTPQEKMFDIGAGF